ncbi:hypothetical protein [Leptolyngbya ectocarpi]|uniref:hypothetical protein n=1 Tax=Leptolyngbya ectocarpi TaxID=1202 RepID=UPI001D1541F9|nr:hypothetical protein [Leptolyngbya ectocarpi]
MGYQQPKILLDSSLDKDCLTMPKRSSFIFPATLKIFSPQQFQRNQTLNNSVPKTPAGQFIGSSKDVAGGACLSDFFLEKND